MHEHNATGSGAREEHVVVFELGDESYGVDIARVHEIIRMQPLTRIPQTPPFMEGIINLRGNVIPVIDLRKRFLAAPATPAAADDRRTIVVEHDRAKIGIIVDAVSEVMRLPADRISPPAALLAGVDVAYLRGVARVGDRLVILLNLDRVLTPAESADATMALAAS